MDELESMREIYDFPPELDFCSDSFDPVCALESYIHLPYPNAKTYNNLAEYYSHTFLKKEDRTKVEKDRPYDRDYSFYYATLGLDINAQERYKRRRLNKIKRMKYAGWRTAKLKKKLPKLDDDPNREPCRSYPPLKSTKIIQTESAFCKRKIFPINNPQNTCSEMSLDNQLNAFMESEMKEDKKIMSHQNDKKSTEISFVPSQEMHPQTSDPSRVDSFVSKDSRHRKRNLTNSSNNYGRKHDIRYKQQHYNSHFRSKNSHFSRDFQPETRNTSLKRRERYP